jgi:hypothetical protein
VKREKIIAAMLADPGLHDLQREHGGLTTYGASRMGGHLDMLPVKEPHIRLFDVPGFVRRVTITVTKYIMGTHHYVHIREQDNPLWLPRRFDKSGFPSPKRPGVWWTAWDDHDKRGREWEQRYTQIRFIEPFIERTLAENFKDIPHHIERETLGATTYGREGD